MIINGKAYNYESMTIEKLIQKLDLDKEHVVFECNGEIITKALFNETVVNKGDRVEIIAFVGGG